MKLLKRSLAIITSVILLVLLLGLSLDPESQATLRQRSLQQTRESSIPPEYQELQYNAQLFGGFGIFKRLLLVLISGEVFRSDKIMVWILNHAPIVFRTHKATPGDTIYILPRGTPLQLPETFVYQGQTQNTQEVLDDTVTATLMVLHEGKIVYEEYFRGANAKKPWMVSSLSKSITSTALSLVLADGLVDNIDDLVTKYLPFLQDTAWSDSTIRNVLTMTAGAEEDFFKIGLYLTLGSSLKDNLIKHKPRTDGGLGTYDYANTNANVISLLVETVTGQTMAKYLQDKLWRPIGVQDPSYILKDNKGVSNGSGWVLTARDCAKIGETLRLQGKSPMTGEQLLDPAWIAEATSQQSVAGNAEPIPNFAYGYFWWLDRDNMGDYMASGAFTNQLYVNPQKGITIVYYGARRNDTVNRSKRIFYLFREIANQFPDVVVRN